MIELSLREDDLEIQSKINANVLGCRVRVDSISDSSRGH